MGRDYPGIDKLGAAFQKKNLTLYLGAGVSVDNGLPTWERLVLAMYFSAISNQTLEGWRPFPNYLFAIAEWYLERNHEPLEVTARRLRRYYQNDHEGFMMSLHKTLYAGFLDEEAEGCGYRAVAPDDLRQANPSLDAVAHLCERGSQHQGVRSVITYNYDNLLQLALGQVPHQTIYSNVALEAERLPIYHVHGFVPYNESCHPPSEDIVFTEDQYHLAARDSYSWHNLVQVQSLANSVGLMIGLSVSDRNIRRLLDAISNAPVKAVNYALLQVPKRKEPTDSDLDYIHHKAQHYIGRFQKSAIKKEWPDRAKVMYPRPGIKSSSRPIHPSGSDLEPIYRTEIRGIIEKVGLLDNQEQTFVLEQLGVTPIWYEEHSEIPEIINLILGQIE